MRRGLAALLFVSGAVGAFVLGMRHPRSQPETSQPTVREPAAVASSQQSAAGGRLGASRREALLKRIADSDTYLPRMLAESDSFLRRWSDRVDDPLHIYEEPTSVEGYSAATGRAIRDAFRRWERVGAIPVSFAYVRKREQADVVVRWITSFPMERAGQAEVMWRSDGWLTEGTLTLATHTPNGRLLATDAIFTVALHEIGHLLGLGHSDDPEDVMYPTTTVHDLTTRDRQTAMLLYTFPPGTLRKR